MEQAVARRRHLGGRASGRVRSDPAWVQTSWVERSIRRHPAARHDAAQLGAARRRPRIRGLLRRALRCLPLDLRPGRSNSRQVLVAVASSRPCESVSDASASAVRRPRCTTRPSQVTRPVPRRHAAQELHVEVEAGVADARRQHASAPRSRWRSRAASRRRRRARTRSGCSGARPAPGRTPRGLPRPGRGRSPGSRRSAGPGARRRASPRSSARPVSRPTWPGRDRGVAPGGGPLACHRPGLSSLPVSRCRPADRGDSLCLCRPRHATSSSPRPAGLFLVQDLVNTRGVPAYGVRDLLGTVADAQRWTRTVRPPLEGALRTPPAGYVGTTSADLPALRRLRREVERAVLVRRRRRGAAARAVPAGARRRRPAACSPPAPALGWLASRGVGRGAARRSATGRGTRLKACRNPHCPCAFHDASRNNSRVWHDVRTCGNVANLRASRARRRPVPRADPGRPLRPGRMRGDEGRQRRGQGVIEGFGTIAAVIALGALLAQLGVLDDRARVVLSRLSFFVASPALMVTVLGDTDVNERAVAEPRRHRGRRAGRVLLYVLAARLVWRRALAETVVGVAERGVRQRRQPRACRSPPTSSATPPWSRRRC